MEDLKYRKLVRTSLITKTNRFEGICEKLRSIYDLLHDYPDEKLREEITEKLVDAFIMGKKMNDRLVYYKNTYNDTTGHAGANIKQLPGTSILRKVRWYRGHKKV